MNKTILPLPSDAPRERHPHPCQHAYTNLRASVLAALTRPKQSGLSRGIQWTARAIFLILDVPIRWLTDLGDTIIGNRGYFAVGSVLAAYLAVFGLIDAKATQEESRASLERSIFMTLVSSGNAASFVAAMKDFGPTQAMPVTEHPLLFKFWEWGRTYQPNMEPMRLWAQWRLGLCKKDCSLHDDTRLDLSRADLSGADLSAGHDLYEVWDRILFERGSGVDLSGADLSYAHLFGADLSEIDLSHANLGGARLTGAHLFLANLDGTNLSHANLGGANLFQANLTAANLTGASLDGANLTAANLTDTKSGIGRPSVVDPRPRSA